MDLGTDSGAIGLSIAVERPGHRVLLTDVSADALTVARANLAGLGIAGGSVEVAHGSWFEAVPEIYRGHCDLIVANPPYIATADVLADSVANWEPHGALRSGEHGLDDLEVLVAQARPWLRAQGAFVLEMGTGQTARVADLLGSQGFSTTIHHDYAGHDRSIVARVAA